ncbi:MAG: DUF2235 domain-containing protein [Thermoanaerobaculia bacterium]
MGRNIVLCLDGTNNEYDATNTNVVKLYAMLDRETRDQLTYYQTGVGTFAPPGIWGRTRRWLITRLDLAIAWLLEDHVTSAYRFLMRTYEEGDEIFLFGFSRGAYGARVLAAMLYKVGLLGRGNEELVPFAWGMFARERDFRLCRGFRHTFARKVRVRFLGLWDTVSSVGWAWSPRHFQFTANNPIVDEVRHAVALDERRTYFIQNLWGSESPDAQHVKQVWFPGVHCDVGGGYEEKAAGLSKISLEWMIREAVSSGLRINQKAREAILPIANTAEYAAAEPLAEKHESLKGFWWVPELIPRRIKDPARNYAARWIWPLGRPRGVPDDAVVHDSVRLRRAGKPGYCPTNLPGAVTFVS